MHTTDTKPNSYPKASPNPNGNTTPKCKTYARPNRKSNIMLTLTLPDPSIKHNQNTVVNLCITF